jgi:hypothetical protein
MVKVPSDNNIAEQIKKIENDVMVENYIFLLENDLNIHRSFGDMSMSMSGIVDKNTVTTKTVFEDTKRLHDFTLPNVFKSFNTITEIKENQKKHLLRKKTFYDRVAFFLPDHIYQNLCEEAAGTDYNFCEKQFTDAVKNYRSIFMNYVQSKNGFGYAFFTQMPESEWSENLQWSQEIRDRYSEPANLSKIATDLPQFNMPHRSKGYLALMGLFLANIIAGGISLWIYNKYLSFK